MSLPPTANEMSAPPPASAAPASAAPATAAPATAATTPPRGAPALALVERLARAGALSPLDRHLARAVSMLEPGDPLVALAAALASRAVQLGHVCVDLSQLDLAELELEPDPELAASPWPSRQELLAALRRSPQVSRIDAATADVAALATPLVLDDSDRLYLQRYARYERTLAAVLLERARRVGDVDTALLGDGIRRLFVDAPGDAAARTPARGGAQARVACVALLHSLAVICGGPGTGKTTTVVKILALIEEQALARHGRPANVLLLAPTGKAARRLAAAVQSGLNALPVSDAVKAAVPSEAFTIHRALGGGASGRFRHDASNPLPADVVLVDEVSMVDLALLYRLAVAIRPQARLILQGDKDQLASVEAGAILGDIYEPSAAADISQQFAAEVSELTGQALTGTRTERGLWDSVVSLDESYRYGAESGIGRLARAINAGDAPAALAVLRTGASSGGARDAELFDPAASSPGQATRELERRVTAGYAAFIRSSDPAQKLEQLGRYRVLCAHRQGPSGVEQQNRNVEEWLTQAGLLDPGGAFYENRPIIVTQNDYTLGLFNGDVGVVVRDEHGRLRVCFEGAEGLRFLAPGRLPPHETVFATTVHKSQGSEFDVVSVVLPEHVSALVGRELLYTAVTRARQRVDIFAPAEVIRSAIARTVQRPSGLRDALWGKRG
jgi:exodeoxyribonuclease V alpha subunit